MSDDDLKPEDIDVALSAVGHLLAEVEHDLENAPLFKQMTPWWRDRHAERNRLLRQLKFLHNRRDDIAAK